MSQGRSDEQRDAEFIPGTDEIKPRRGRVELRRRMVPWTFSTGDGELRLDMWADIGLATGWTRKETVILDEHDLDGRGHPYTSIRERDVSLTRLVEEFPERREELLEAHGKLIQRASIAIDRATDRPGRDAGGTARDGPVKTLDAVMPVKRPFLNTLARHGSRYHLECPVCGGRAVRAISDTHGRLEEGDFYCLDHREPFRARLEVATSRLQDGGKAHGQWDAC